MALLAQGKKDNVAARKKDRHDESIFKGFDDKASTLKLCKNELGVFSAEKPLQMEKGGFFAVLNGEKALFGKMSVKNCERKVKVYASQLGAALDSDVMKGGGTDDTEILQAFLDTAPQKGGIHLVMDGASLIRGLRIHSNTTIECMNKSCGFFLADNSNCAVVKNYHLNYTERHDSNITLIGGVYNQNCLNQLHDGPYTSLEGESFTLDCFNEDPQTGSGEIMQWTVGLQFYGVEYLTVRDVTIRNQRTFAALIANAEHVDMQNIFIDLPDKMYAQNQDGLHFWGPSRFITLRNIVGNVGDDFIALAPGEHDHVSDITDVLIDGVILKDADQGIRMLSRGTGKLDRVIIKNVTGTYRSFGFYVNNWFPNETTGHFGHITVDTCDLRHQDPAYDYTAQFLFQIGGKIDCLTLKNITHLDPYDNRSLMRVGYPWYSPLAEGEAAKWNEIRQIEIDGLNIMENNSGSADAVFIAVDCPVELLKLSGVTVQRSDDMPREGSLLKLGKEGEVGTLLVDRVYTKGLKKTFDLEDGKVGFMSKTNVIEK